MCSILYSIYYSLHYTFKYTFGPSAPKLRYTVFYKGIFKDNASG